MKKLVITLGLIGFLLSATAFAAPKRDILCAVDDGLGGSLIQIKYTKDKASPTQLAFDQKFMIGFERISKNFHDKDDIIFISVHAVDGNDLRFDRVVPTKEYSVIDGRFAGAFLWDRQASLKFEFLANARGPKVRISCRLLSEAESNGKESGFKELAQSLERDLNRGVALLDGARAENASVATSHSKSAGDAGSVGANLTTIRPGKTTSAL